MFKSHVTNGKAPRSLWGTMRRCLYYCICSFNIQGKAKFRSKHLNILFCPLWVMTQHLRVEIYTILLWIISIKCVHILSLCHFINFKKTYVHSLIRSSVNLISEKCRGHFRKMGTWSLLKLMNSCRLLWPLLTMRNQGSGSRPGYKTKKSLETPEPCSEAMHCCAPSPLSRSRTPHPDG